MSIANVPPRQPATTALWSHLIKTDTLSSNGAPKPPVVPIHPADKAGTSARLLLSDTQAQFQKFSDVMQKSFAELTETKREMRQMKKMFEDDRDRLERFIHDSVQSSQIEIQKGVAKPAQADKLEDMQKFFMLTNVKLEGVDKRIDALQSIVHSQAQISYNLASSTETRITDLDKRVDTLCALVQAQTQLFQVHTRELHTLQEQQAAIITSLAPLKSLSAQFDDTKNLLLKELKSELSSLGKRKRSREDFEPGARENVSSAAARAPQALHTKHTSSLLSNSHRRIQSPTPVTMKVRQPLTELQDATLERGFTLAPTMRSNVSPSSLGLIATRCPLPPAPLSHTPSSRTHFDDFDAHKLAVISSASILQPNIKHMTLQNGKRFIPIMDDDDEDVEEP